MQTFLTKHKHCFYYSEEADGVWADPKFDTTMTIDGHKVIIPQGKPVKQPSYKDSQFSQSEYLIYREDQCRIRYLLKLKFWSPGTILSVHILCEYKATLWYEHQSLTTVVQMMFAL